MHEYRGGIRTGSRLVALRQFKKGKFFLINCVQRAHQDFYFKSIMATYKRMSCNERANRKGLPFLQDERARNIVPRSEGDPVILQFGHGNTPERVGEVERIASLVKSELRLERTGAL